VSLRVAALEAVMAAAATDAGRLRELSEELAVMADQRDELEGAWLELSEELEA
jgi:ABC transport system ATP-binding/permease protein